MERRLSDPPYLAFPLRIGPAGPTLANRGEHIRHQIEQVLFTLAGERVFRPEFGAGVKALVFEGNSQALRAVTQRRVTASLAEALTGEVNPKSIDVDVRGDGAKLIITVAYTLATIGQRERHLFTLETE